MALRPIFAIDLGTNVGWAFGLPGEVPRCGTQLLPPFLRGWGAMLAAYSDWLADQIEAIDPVEIVREVTPGLQFIDHYAPQVMMGLAGTTELVAYRWERRTVEANVNTVRKAVCGSGRAKKDQVSLEMIKRGCKPDSHNASDAAAVFFWRAEQILREQSR